MKRDDTMERVILSLAPLPADLVKLLIQQTPGLPDFEVISGQDMSDDEVRNACAGADIVLGDYTFKRGITADTISAARKLKFIQQPSVGYQHIDVDACTRAGILVANTAGANTDSVAEHTVAWGLCLLKNMLRAHAGVRQGKWEQMELRPSELRGKVWGLVGFGNIGQAVAMRLRPFGLQRVIYTDIARKDAVVESECGAEYCDLDTLLGQADIVSLHAPLTESNRHMIDRDALGTMKQGAFLINVARAELVNEGDLADALREGRIAGAAIDVFSEEPVSAGNPLLQVESDRLLFSPHVAGVSIEAAGRIINAAVANIARVLKGEPPESLVN